MNGSSLDWLLCSFCLDAKRTTANVQWTFERVLWEGLYNFFLIKSCAKIKKEICFQALCPNASNSIKVVPIIIGKRKRL